MFYVNHYLLQKNVPKLAILLTHCVRIKQVTKYDSSMERHAYNMKYIKINSYQHVLILLSSIFIFIYY